MHIFFRWNVITAWVIVTVWWLWTTEDIAYATVEHTTKIVKIHATGDQLFWVFCFMNLICVTAMKMSGNMVKSLLQLYIVWWQCIIVPSALWRFLLLLYSFCYFLYLLLSFILFWFLFVSLILICFVFTFIFLLYILFQQLTILNSFYLSLRGYH